MNKTVIKNYATWARKKLMNDISVVAGLYGITEEKTAEPLPSSTKDIQYFDIGSKQPSQLTRNDISFRNKLVNYLNDKKTNHDYKNAYKQLIETTASSWFNRLAALRFMEVNGYFDDGMRILSSSSEGMTDPDIISAPFDSDLSFTEEEKHQIIEWKDKSNNDELFRFLLFKRCNQLSGFLPGLFESKEDSSEFLMRLSYIDHDGVVYHLTHDIEEEDWKDQVQIIGWLYQYYNSEFGVSIKSRQHKQDRQKGLE